MKLFCFIQCILLYSHLLILFSYKSEAVFRVQGISPVLQGHLVATAGRNIKTTASALSLLLPFSLFNIRVTSFIIQVHIKCYLQEHFMDV